VNNVAVSTLPVPSMYADHHVTEVRQILQELSGVQDIQASAAFREVTVKHTNEVSKKALVDALEKGGYSVGEAKQVEQGPSCLGDPAWYMCASRCIKTDQADLEMSGDFRRY
jgi:copper chaperone CopZ